MYFSKVFNKMTRIALGLGLIGLVSIISPAMPTTAAAQNNNPQIVLLEDARGPLAPSMAEYIERGLEQADDMNAELVIIVLDTPGGQVNLMQRIVQDIANSDVPVAVYVGPRGAQAASAGLFITLAGEVAAMAPDTAIGASSPIAGNGQDIGETAETKAKEALAAQARSLTEDRGEEAQEIANDAVFEAKAVSAQEALEAGLIDFLVEDADALIEELDGYTVTVNGRERTLNTSNAAVTLVSMNWVEELLTFITNPNLIALLLTLGPLLIIIEVRTPGGGAAGVAGVICLAIAFYGLGVMPVNWFGGAFILLALVFLVLELTSPTFGLFTAGGIVSLVIGLVILFNQPGIEPFGQLSLPIVIGQALVFGALFLFFAYQVLKTRLSQPTTGNEGLIGQVGRVSVDLEPEGIVHVFGERWRAESEDGRTIPAGERVEVVSVKNMRMIVRPVKKTRGLRYEDLPEIPERVLDN